MPQTEARVWNTGTQENPIFNFELPAGPKGEPGGWNIGTNLGAVTNNTAIDLDTITTPGLYWQGSTGTVTSGLYNYPPMVDVNGSVRGVLEVTSWGGSSGTAIQRYTTIGTGFGGSGAQRPRVMYSRTFLTGGWSAWSATPSMRVDNSVGRAVYMWDEQANREQLIYGDTGNVNISQFLHPSFQAPENTDRVNIRRIGQSVTLTIRVKPSESIVGSGRNENRVILNQIPPGFRENPTSYGNSYMGSASPAFAPIAFGATNTNSDFRVRGPSGEQWRSGEIISLVATWFTNDPWPSTLTFTS